MILMENNINKFASILIGCLFPIAVLSQSPLQYKESEGIIIIEIESALDDGSWSLDTNRVGYTGEGYLHYKGPNFYNTPGNSLLNIEIAIEKTGKYRFQWHSLIAVGQSNTEHNDSWLRFKDASDFYGQKGERKVYPKGVGKTPNPEGASANGWLKIYQNTLNNWTWSTRTNDKDPYEVYVEFDSVGVYTIEISGRSNGHAINRIALYHSEVNASQALNLTRPESEKKSTVNIQEPPLKTLQIRPTLANRIIYLDIPASIYGDEHEGQIINLLGQPIQSFSFRPNGKDEGAIPISHLSKGIYFIRIQKDAFYYQGKFIKQ